jgi:hypothetical protein
MLNILKKSAVAKGCKFSLYALTLIGASNRNRLPPSRSILELDPIKAKYSINKLSVAEKESVIVRINPRSFIACGQEINMMMIITLTVNMYT